MTCIVMLIAPDGASAFSAVRRRRIEPNPTMSPPLSADSYRHPHSVPPTPMPMSCCDSNSSEIEMICGAACPPQQGPAGWLAEES